MVVATLALAAGVLYYSSLNPFSPSQGESSVTGVQCSSYSATFTVVATQSGYNDSIGHGAPSKYWPVLCTYLGEEVKITFVNQDTVEPPTGQVGYFFSDLMRILGAVSDVRMRAVSPIWNVV